MALFIIILLILALTGTLWTVVQISLGVALGVFLAFVLIAGLVWWRVRRALRGQQDRWRRVRGSSRIEILDRRDPPL